MGTISNGAKATLDLPAVPARRERLKDTPAPRAKRVVLAAPRGYCAGVDRAVIAVEKALRNFGEPVYVRKQIVHNIHVVSTLERQGAIFVDDVTEVPEGAHVVFSAHGVSPAVVQGAADRNLQAIDATCPLVTKVHREATRFSRDDYQILLIGHAGHEEVEGTMGHAPERTILVNGPEDVPFVEVDDVERLVWLSQTTLSVDETMETVRLLRERFPTLQDPPSDDICYATQNRQVAIKKVAEEAELVIVVGSANSSNTVRLVDVALENGAKAAYRVDYASEIKQEWLDGVSTIGVTSGASVPEVLVQEVLTDLADAGFADVSTVVTAEEDLMFSLPKELRTDAAGNPDERGLGGRVRKLDWQSGTP
ncbi:4-hydroxy-3-methylbut-2-enyl diphosphate reductase [Microbacteriaceae bacterium SG_E_30_P1]|uniref:4-hydroxy-3-methylbut-2-enyl diphosphate reductase n=1 Tax=Antiquaquibacter oligotrophicus TaxID=2880260 RepID=A0ABT6KK16_9MICO|nr:4-hydroxy-3-methylbut-2-enyl diphosphate reductase [Antiquaquibacter oligotrophicus]